MRVGYSVADQLAKLLFNVVLVAMVRATSLVGLVLGGRGLGCGWWGRGQSLRGHI